MSEPTRNLAGQPGEFHFIRWLTRWLEKQGRGGRVVLGPGDDCATVRIGGKRVHLTTDCLIEGTHFRRDWISGAELGRRAFLVSASDLAAMGAAPWAALLSLEAPPRTPPAYLHSILRGFATACRRHKTDLVGGNLAGAPALGVTAFLLGGSGAAAVPRGRARPGDLLMVSGTLGDAGGGLALLRARCRQELSGGSARRLLDRWLKPPSRLELAGQLARQKAARAMIDVSDGLLQDLGHMCRASRVGAVVESARLPISAALRREFGARATTYALRGGEDYEILFATPPRLARVAHAIAGKVGCEITEIGRLVKGKSLQLVEPSGRRRSPRGSLGFDHLRQR